ncbi:uncharacterized protein LOC144911079 isoform X1 [Branchiostoma floridae x Branchiostoma belcheri]
MSPCCRSKCSRRFTYRDLKKKREKYFGSGDASARSSWLVEKLSTFQNDEDKLKSTFSFKADGRMMCRKAWCRLYGISRKVYYRSRTAFLDGRPSASDRIRPRREKSKVYVKANVWFEMYLAAHAEKMPHRKEKWLPYRTRKQGVYHQYRQDMAEQMEPYCSKQTFYNMWNEMHPDVFIKKSSLFTKCKKCVQLERKLERTRIPNKREEIQERRRAHLGRQMRERINYYRRREAAHRNPNRYLSLIVDGMDQAKTYLPHFVGAKSKDMASTDLMKVHVSGIISHGHGIKATYTDVFEYSHDSNLTINLLLKMLYRLSKRGPLPPIQSKADNCFRENKNRFMLAFLDLLVHRNIFVEVQLSFLYVGHTHEDIDQLFSQIADRLRHEEARTPKRLLEILPDAAEMRGLYDVRGWLEPYIINIKGHSKVGMFRFRQSKTMKDRVDMFYRRSHDHKWKILRTGMFRTDNENVPVRPSGKPKLLLPVFEKREINVGNLMTQKLPKWSPYLESEEEAKYWKEYLGQLKSASQSLPAKIRYASGDGTGWLLERLSPCDPAELEKGDGAETGISEELDRLLEEELESAEIVVQGSTMGKKRKRGGNRGRGRRSRGARGGGRGRGRS